MIDTKGIRMSNCTHGLDGIQATDILAVSPRGFLGSMVLKILSLGGTPCYTSHNAPVLAGNDELMVLQFEPPVSRLVSLCDYLDGRDDWIALRPVPLLRLPPYKLIAYQHELTRSWETRIGVLYDAWSLWDIFIRLLGFRGKGNDPDRWYCTEGTLDPHIHNTILPWTLRSVQGVEYPTPFHIEMGVRMEELAYVAGNSDLFEQIFTSC